MGRFAAWVEKRLRIVLAVEGPAEDAFGTAPGGVVRPAERLQPVVDQGRLADAAEGDQDEDAGGVVREGFVEAAEMGVASEEVGPGTGRREMETAGSVVVLGKGTSASGPGATPWMPARRR